MAKKVQEHIKMRLAMRWKGPQARTGEQETGLPKKRGIVPVSIIGFQRGFSTQGAMIQLKEEIIECYTRYSKLIPAERLRPSETLGHPVASVKAKIGDRSYKHICFQLFYTSPDEVINTMKETKVTSAGIDQINPCNINRIVHLIAEPLAHIIILVFKHVYFQLN